MTNVADMTWRIRCQLQGNGYPLCNIPGFRIRSARQWQKTVFLFLRNHHRSGLENSWWVTFGQPWYLRCILIYLCQRAHLSHIWYQSPKVFVCHVWSWTSWFVLHIALVCYFTVLYTCPSCVLHPNLPLCTHNLQPWLPNVTSHAFSPTSSPTF